MNDGWIDKTELNVNEVSFLGKRITDFKICYISNGETFYKATFASERKSGFMDCIPVIVSSRTESRDSPFVRHAII